MEQETPYQQLVEPVKFTDGTKTYVYDYSKVNVEMAEFAISIQELKELSRQKPPQTIADISRSRSAEWAITCAAYLLREEIDGKIVPFNGDIEPAVTFLKNLEGEEPQLRMREITRDFFTRRGRGETISKLLEGAQKIDVTSMFFKQMMEQARE